MNEPWLSVLVPVYNVAPYLRTGIEALLHEADDGVELFLLDDASTDGSAAIAAELAAQHPGRVQLQRFAHNQGVSAARNALLASARGRWLWFLDADDGIAPGVLPRLKALLHEADAPELLLVDYRVQRARPSFKHRLRGEHHRPAYVGPGAPWLQGGPPLLQGVLASGNVFCWTVIARRTLWQRGPRFPVGRVFEDMTAMPRLLLQADSARHVREPWVAYLRRDDSVSSQLSAPKVADLSAALVGLREELLQRWPDAPVATVFAVTHQCARNLVAAVRHARRLPTEQADVLLPSCRADFRAAVGDDLALLWCQYRRRGWWARAWALRQALGSGSG